MGLLDSLKVFVRAVETEYDRRIRAASNVKTYHVGGHSVHDTHPAGSVGANGRPSAADIEHLQGEGGAVGGLQANAGPQVGDRG